MSRDLVGFRALGRHGELGIVVDVTGDDGADAELIVVRGGVTHALTFFVPVARVLALSRRSRTVSMEVDFADFVPSLRQDGTVELRALP